MVALALWLFLLCISVYTFCITKMLIIQIPIKKKVCMVVRVFAVLSSEHGDKHCRSYSRVSTSKYSTGAFCTDGAAFHYS